MLKVHTLINTRRWMEACGNDLLEIMCLLLHVMDTPFYFIFFASGVCATKREEYVPVYTSHMKSDGVCLGLKKIEYLWLHSRGVHVEKGTISYHLNMRVQERDFFPFNRSLCVHTCSNG